MLYEVFNSLKEAHGQESRLTPLDVYYLTGLILKRFKFLKKLLKIKFWVRLCIGKMRR